MLTSIVPSLFLSGGAQTPPSCLSPLPCHPSSTDQGPDQRRNLRPGRHLSLFRKRRQGTEWSPDPGVLPFRRPGHRASVPLLVRPVGEEGAGLARRQERGDEGAAGQAPLHPSLPGSDPLPSPLARERAAGGGLARNEASLFPHLEDESPGVDCGPGDQFLVRIPRLPGTLRQPGGLVVELLLVPAGGGRGGAGLVGGIDAKKVLRGQGEAMG